MKSYPTEWCDLDSQKQETFTHQQKKNKNKQSGTGDLSLLHLLPTLLSTEIRQIRIFLKHLIPLPLQTIDSHFDIHFDIFN